MLTLRFGTYAVKEGSDRPPKTIQEFYEINKEHMPTVIEANTPKGPKKGPIQFILTIAIKKV